MKSAFSSHSAVLALAFACSIAFACSSGTTSTPSPDQGPPLLPGEICDAANRPDLHWFVDAPVYHASGDTNGDVILPADSPPAPQKSTLSGTIVVATGGTRPVRIVVEPDFCAPATMSFATSNAGVVAAPGDVKMDLRHAAAELVITGLTAGTATITATVNTTDPNGRPIVNTLDVPFEVRDTAEPPCDSGLAATGNLGDTCDGDNCRVTGASSSQLSGAFVSARANAFVRTDEFALPKFPVTIACDSDIASSLTNAKLLPLGPAVTFTAHDPMTMSKPMRREVEVAIPVNPAIFPTAARGRHLVVVYKGPRVKTPRAIAVASPRIEKSGDGYVLRFQTPWLGTFQAAVKSDAGTNVHTRHLTHRAVIGFSMGGGGAGVFGMRHHDQFDVIGPLGGPSDWTWLLWYIENYALGGFCPAGQTCPVIAPNRYPLDEPYAHTMDYEHWFYQEGNGNGGHFPRSEYVQIFEDLALAMGNPNGSGSDPLLQHVAAGPTSADPFITMDDGNGKTTNCSFTVEPISKDPDEMAQQALDAQCKAWRCDPKHQWVANSAYFDDEYNPDGSLPVSTFCDGGQVDNGPMASPYENTWVPGAGNTMPVNLGLFVDVNKNGVRDAGEPIIRSSHEPWTDCGADGLCDAQEPGYDRETNPDPNQDDYDYMLSPAGTEGNHRWDPGEPYKDFGLDGVADTKGRSIIGDVGENDGQFTMSFGLTNFLENDPHSILNGRAKSVPGGPFTDDALRRLDILSDGGVRDLFNFAVVASHFQGQIEARLGPDGLPIRPVAYYNGFQTLPGQPSAEQNFSPGAIRWNDVMDMPSVRYGDLDATAAMIANGDGQHVGTVNQLLARLETAFFYVSKRWPDADHLLYDDSRVQPTSRTYDQSLYTGAKQPDDLDAQHQLDCEIAGHCEHDFTGPKTGRRGPIAVSLPPGYDHEEVVKRGVRYPVLYVLHGYGQSPEDLDAVAIFTNNFMNVAQRSYATRLAKFIIVYVDGRCREPKDASGTPKPECIRGTFYMQSARPDGAKMDDWFDEVVDFIDTRYRTMPAADIDVVE